MKISSSPAASDCCSVIGGSVVSRAGCMYARPTTMKIASGTSLPTVMTLTTIAPCRTPRTLIQPKRERER